MGAEGEAEEVAREFECFDSDGEPVWDEIYRKMLEKGGLDMEDKERLMAIHREQTGKEFEPLFKLEDAPQHGPKEEGDAMAHETGLHRAPRPAWRERAVYLDRWFRDQFTIDSEVKGSFLWTACQHMAYQIEEKGRDKAEVEEEWCSFVSEMLTSQRKRKMRQGTAPSKEEQEDYMERTRKVLEMSGN